MTRGAWRSALIWAALAVSAGVAGFAYVSRTRPVATSLCVAEAVPEEARLVGTDWVWLERTKDAEAVVVVRQGRRNVIARHARIAGFWPAASRIAWAALDGETWTIRTSRPDGSDTKVVTECPGRPLAVWTSGTDIAWLIDVPTPSKTMADFIPTLGRKAELWRSRDGQPRRVGELAEAFTTAQILGYREGAFLVAGVREEGIRCSVLYVVGPHLAPIRLAGEAGAVRAMLSSDGQVYWTAPSRGSNSLLTGCIRTADLSSLLPETVADWLPAGGTPNETRRGVVVTGGGSETAWRIDPERRIGVPIPMLPDQWPVGAGGDLLLTVRRAKMPGKVAVNTVRMP